MKRTLFMLTFLMLAVLLIAAEGTINLGNSSNRAELLRSTADGLSIRYGVEAIDYKEVSTNGGSFTDLSIRDYAFTNKTGFPRLPLLRQIISVPVGAQPRVEIVSADRISTSLRSYGLSQPVLPRQESVAKCEDISQIEFVVNNDFYNSRSWTDYEPVQLEELGYMRGERLFAVDFAPVKYNPATSEIEVIRSAEVQISFVGADHAATQALKERTWSPAFENVFARTILNFNRETQRPSLIRHPMGYVIISPSNFVSALQPFVDWKTVEGFNVTVATTETIGSSASQIKTYLQGLWNSATPEEPAPTYLLIVGDVAQVPSNSGNAGSHVTDLTYVRLEGTDYVPEMYFGRFSATTATEVSNQVSKTMMHEQYTMPDDSYLSEVVMIAGVDSYWSQTHANGQINYGTNNYFNATNGITSHTYLYPASGSSASSIVADISAGVGYANYTAHGSQTSWADPSFTINNINSLQNANEYPVLVGNCCVTNAFDTGICFGEAWLRAVNKGGVAYIGGTNNTYWDEDYYWGVGHKPPAVGTGSPFIPNRTGAYDAMFHTHNEPFADWAATTGATTFMGNMAVVASNSTRINYYWEIYMVMGDPSLNVYLGIPPVVNANVPETTFIGLSSLEMTLEPYTYAALSMNGVLHGVGLADEMGNLNLSYTPFESSGTAQLVLTRSRLRPTFISIDVVPNEGPYVMVTSVGVNDGNNSIAEAGEEISLDLNLSNVGIQDASNLTATLSTGNPYVSLLDSQINLPNVNAGGTAMVNDAFTLQVSEYIPDQELVALEIMITDGTNEWTSTRSLTVNAPLVEVESVEYEDQNGNGFNESGETVTITVNLTNTGHMTTAGGEVHLVLNSDYASLETTSFMLPGIAPGLEIPLSFTIDLGMDIPDGTVIPLGMAYTAGMQMLNYTVMIPVGAIGEDFESGGFTTFPWVNSSASPWVIASGAGNVNGGNYSAKSGTIGNSSSTTLQLTLNVGADGNISFYRKVSSESNYDWLKFSIDEQELGSWSGNQDWAQFSYPVTAGSHTFKWTYSKDYSYTSGSDCAWIDDIVFPMSGSGEIAMLYLPVDQIALGEVPAMEYVEADFMIRNLGNIDLNGQITTPTGFDLSHMGSALPNSYSYAVPAGGTLLFTLGYQTEMAQTINEELMITSNDPSNPVTAIPITMSVVSNEDATGAPLVTRLEGNYPNPFNPETTISFSLKDAGALSLKVYNLRGQLVRDLFRGEMSAGRHSIVWDGRDNRGSNVGSGVYMYRMESANYSKTMKMILVK